MTSSDPWAGIPTPTPQARNLGRRASDPTPWDCFWVKDSHGRRAWTMLLGTLPAERPALPHVHGIDVAVHANDTHDGGNLLLTLLDAKSWPQFATLCHDVMASTRASDSETDALRAAVHRTWRWHHLMRGAPSGLLSEQEQKGLFGELHVLQHLVLPHVPAPAGIDGWRGPLDAPKDFEVGHVAIEVKTRRGGASPHVRVSSEHQLDTSGVPRVYLVVNAVISPADGSGESVTQKARSLVEHLDRTAPDVLDLFDTRLAAAGLRWEDDYSNHRWQVTETAAYEVADPFPRIQPVSLPAGVERVTYVLQLDSIATFRRDTKDLADAFGGDHERHDR